MRVDGCGTVVDDANAVTRPLPRLPAVTPKRDCGSLDVETSVVP